MSMTIQQAIDKIAVHYKTSVDCYHQAISKGFYTAANGHRRDMEAEQMALVALREKAKREDPKPLTLEELRQMDGEPVWIKADHYGVFADVVHILGKDDGDAFIGFKINYRLQENGYGKTWIAYRHKPKEVHYAG
jgi:hypothetical protein